MNLIRKRKGGSEQIMALRLVVKSLHIKILCCLITTVSLLEIYSLLENFLFPDVFLKSSNFHESDMMSL